MLEFTFRFMLADETASDEALIAGLPHDLRAIADQVAEAWPGSALDGSLNPSGQLARPAQLEFELEHGGRGRLEVRTASAIRVAPRADRSANPPATVDSTHLEALLADVVSPETWNDLQRQPLYAETLRRAETALTQASPKAATLARRLLAAFAGDFSGLEAKDRSGVWTAVEELPAVDPFYVCAVLSRAGSIRRIPLPQLLPEAAASRRSFVQTPETQHMVALLEIVAPTQLATVRQAGRAYLARRREWASRGRYSK